MMRGAQKIALYADSTLSFTQIHFRTLHHHRHFAIKAVLLLSLKSVVGAQLFNGK